MVQARREVSELVSSMVEAGGGLPLPEDRLLTIMEAAQVHSPLRTTPLLSVTIVVVINPVVVASNWLYLKVC